MTIRKGVLHFTFMFDDRHMSVDEVNAMSVEDILAESNDGLMLGLTTNWGEYGIVEVPNDQVAAEEIALNCDGTFFADPDELQHAILDHKYRTLPETTLFDLCEQKGIQLVEADEEEIRGRWDWLDGHGNASDASLDTKRAAAIDALVTLDEGEDDGTNGQDRDGYSDTQDRSNYSVDE